VAVGAPTQPPSQLERVRGFLAERSRVLRDRLNRETDEECVAADTANGIPFYGIMRSLRNREGEQ
jgi:hypothetical protein